jgi:hypothetical protein
MKKAPVEKHVEDEKRAAEYHQFKTRAKHNAPGKIIVELGSWLPL